MFYVICSIFHDFMIICLTTEGKNLNSLLATHFEKSKYFLFVDEKRKELEVIPNKPNGQLSVHLVAEKGPDLVITGNIGPSTYDFLKASGVKIVSGVFGITAKRALEKYKKGEIKVIRHIPGAGRGRTL